MKFLTGTLARILFVAPFLIFGLTHIFQANVMIAVVPEFLPGRIFWVYLTGIALVSGSVAILANKFARSAAFGIALFLLTVISMVHIPKVWHEGIASMALVGLLSNIGLLGGSLLLAGITK